MLAYSGKGKFVVEAIDLNEFVEEMAHLLEVSISKKAVLKYEMAADLPAFNGDTAQVRQIIMNLITNASEALGEEGGVITLSTGAAHCQRAYLDTVDMISNIGLDEPLPEGLYVHLEVSDTGCGMDADTIGRIFDPFFTTKFTGRGLGMSAVLGIVRGHGGAIQIDSEAGRGSTFRVLFPAFDRPSELVTTEPAGEEEWRGSGTVLLVDDEQAVLRVAKRMLERMGFQVLCVNDGREALAAFRAHAAEIVCVLLDLTMPQLDGEQVFREIRRMQPDASVILTSGYDESDITQRFAGEGLAGFIQKPYRSDSLRAKLREILGS
jgi:CheY-like chemotaxis protein